MARAPRKYLDRDRTEISLAWRAWRAAEEQRRRPLVRTIFGPGYDDALYPEDVGKEIPDGGCWIRVIEEPYTVLRHRFRVPVMSVWRARRYTSPSGGMPGRRPQLAAITTPGGDLCLYPHEYAIWDDVSWLVGREPDITMHSLGGKPLIDPEQLFYLMKAGVSQNDAALLMLGTLDQTDLVWFEFAPEYAEQFGRIGQPLWRHIQLSKLRA